MAPPPVTLSYDIPKNRTVSITTQKARYSSLDLNPGPVGGKPLDLLHLAITADAVIDTNPLDPDAPLRRTLTLSAVEPDFDLAFGLSELPSSWNLQTLFQHQIEQGLATQCTVFP